MCVIRNEAFLGWQMKWLLTWSVLSFSFQLYAQIISDTTANTQNFEIDTIQTTWFELDRVGIHHPWTDTLLDGVQHYDPARLQKLDFATLGNLGSPARPQFFEIEKRQGLDIGLHQFDLYYLLPERFQFFEHPRGFSEVSHTAGNEQADGYLKTKLGRTFSNGINLSIRHERIFQTGQNFHFQHQQSKQSVLGIGLYLAPLNARFHTAFVYFANISEQQDNGGILLETDGVERPFEEIVATDQAATRHSQKGVLMKNSYRITGKNEQASSKAITLSAFHTARYQIASFKFSERAPDEADSTLYTAFPLDDRGLRMYLEHKQLSNSFALRTQRIRKSTTEKTSERFDLFEAGILHKFHWISQEPVEFNRNELFLTGQAEFMPGRVVQFQAQAHFGLLGKTAGDYRIEGEMNFRIKEWGRFTGKFVQQLNEPYLLSERFFVTQTLVWENDFLKKLESSVEIRFDMKKWALDAGGRYSLINNLVYFDTLSFPKQTTLPVNVASFWLSKNFRIWRLHLDNLIAIQTASEDFLQLPTLFATHSLYFEDKIFRRKLDFRFGFDGRYYGNHTPVAYHPLTGQFHRQSSQGVNFYPQIDAHLSMRIKGFRAFFRFENALEIFGTSFVNDAFGQRYFYQVADHPYPNSTIRWGISWKLSG